MNDPIEFDAIISLGAHCCVGHQIKRVFGKSFSGPFENIVTPFNSIIKIFDEDFAKVSIVLKAISEGTSVVDAHYGLCFHHEFDRDPEQNIIYSSRAIEECRAKMLHKWERMRSYFAIGRVLFVRYGSFTAHGIAHVGIPEDDGMKYSDLNRLTDAIDRRAPGVDYRVVYISHPQIWGEIEADAALDDRFDLHQMSWTDGLPWTGDDAMWTEVFAPYRLAGEQPEPYVFGLPDLASGAEGA